jgi:hypothetical protein
MDLIDDIKWFRSSHGWFDCIVYGLGPCRFSAVAFLSINLFFVYQGSLSVDLVIGEGTAWAIAWFLGELTREAHARMRAARYH